MNRPLSPARWWDLPAASLLIVALLTAATRLVVTNWTEGLSVVQTIVVLGAIAGLALGQSRFSPRLVAFFAIVYGAFAVPWQLGLSVKGILTWPERMAVLVERLTTIIGQLSNRAVVQDSLLFVVLMAVLFWVLSVHAGYSLTRYGASWRVILPTGLALFVINSFDAIITRRAWYLAVYLFFGLVLVARMTYLQHHTRWQQSRTALPPHLGLDFIRFTLLASALIVVFSWTVPALANALPAAERAFQPVKQSWNEMRDHMDNAFASLRTTVGVVSDYYGSSVLLGRGNRLTDTPVFQVKVLDPLPGSVRLYWRARVYDTYDNQWLSSAPSSRSFNPEKDRYSFPKDESRVAGTFEVQTATYITTLFSPAQPLWVSRTSQAELAVNSDGTVDLAAFRANPSVAPGQSYQVQAALSDATETQLRSATTEYPDWIEKRYLQLPREITPRTRELAATITAGLDNPYDKAQAITNWLRRNISYNETVPNRPARQEAVDWFLFDLKEGFCNYYATAEVVLLRSLGIPARWAVGYAQGEKVASSDTYVVRQRDAHAWPEVYFPGFGWVEFEPTSAQPLISRPSGGPNDPSGAVNQNRSADDLQRQLEEELALQRQDRGRLNSTGADTSQSGFSTVMRIGLPLLAAAVLIFLGWRNRARLNLERTPIVLEATLLRAGIRPPKALHLWARRASLPPLTRSYLEINSALHRMGEKPQANLTPAERAASLGKALPPSEAPAQRLVAEYQIATFSPLPADVQAAREAGTEIRKLSWVAMLKRWLGKLQRGRKTPASH